MICDVSMNHFIKTKLFSQIFVLPISSSTKYISLKLSKAPKLLAFKNQKMHQYEEQLIILSIFNATMAQIRIWIQSLLS